MNISFHTRPVILTYHSISHGRSPLCTPPEVFVEQMAWLAASPCRVVSLAELVVGLASKQALPPRAVVLTFDDGFEDFGETAYPILRNHGFPVTVFLVSEYCGRTNLWPGQPGWVEERRLMDWSKIKEIAAEGITFGSHSATHADLSRLTSQAIEQEVLSSKGELEAQLGRPVEFFCYPYGRRSGKAGEIVSRHYLGACGVNMRRVQADSDLFCLPRIDAFYLRSPLLFRQLFTLGGSAYLAMRKALRTARAHFSA